MAINYVDVILHGGPDAGPLRVPTLDGVPPPTLDRGSETEVAQYALTDELDHLERPVYRPSPMLAFRFEDPDTGGRA